MLLAVALQVAPAAEDAFARRSWGHVRREEALSRRMVRIDMASEWDVKAKRFEHKFRLISRGHEGEMATLWASSRTCEGAEEVASLAGLPLPRPQTPSFDTEIIVDGVGYSVTVQVGYGRQSSGPLTFSSNVGTPLAAWVDGAIAKLEHCWSPVEPRFP